MIGLVAAEGAALVVVDEGSDSSKEAPNEEVGLNGLMPANPVACGCSGENGAVVMIEGVVLDVAVDGANERLEKLSDSAVVDVV